MTSTAQITEEDDALQNSIDALEKAVGQVRAATDLTAKRKEEKVARSQLNKVKSEANAFRNSAQRLEDPTQRSVFNRKYSKYDQQLKDFDKELKNLITAPKGGSGGGASAGGGGRGARGKGAKDQTYEEQKMDEIMGEGGADGSGFDSAKAVMQSANRAQDDINKSLIRSLRLGHTMRDQTHEMLETLSKQTEKLYQIDKELEDLDGELDRAKTDVLWFFRQMAKDRCCYALMITLLLAVIGLIFWKIYSNRFPNAPGAITTTTQVPTTSFAGQTAAPPIYCITSWICG